jgi:hypothetical protein
MKNENISSNKLDDYFALARDMQPVAGVEEMERRIVNAKMGSKKSFFYTPKFKIIMSTSIIVIAAYITSLFFPSENKQKSILKPTSGNQLTLEKGYVNKNPQIKLSNNDKSISSFVPNQSTPAEPSALTLETTDPNNILSYLPGVIPLSLDKAQLEKLGFETGENGEGIIYTTGISGLGTMYYSNDAAGSTQKLNAFGFILNKIRDYYPVFISDGTSFIPHDMDAGLRKENKFLLRDSLIDVGLVPVIIKQSEYGKFEGAKDIIFWFKSTPDLQKIISGEKINDANFVKLSKMAMAIKELTSSDFPCSSSQNASTPERSGNSQDPLKFNGTQFEKNIKPLQLDREHLARMGFDPNTKYLLYSENISHIGNFRYKNDDTSVETNTNDISLKNLENKTFDFYPAFITNTLGENPDAGGETGPINIDSELQAEVNKPYSNYAKSFNLIPVLFKQSDYNGFQGHSDIIFWFTATEKLKSILSDINQALPVVHINRYEADYRKNHPFANQIPAYIPRKSVQFLGHSLSSADTVKVIMAGQSFTLNRNVNPQKISATDMVGIKYIELNKKQLERLGFKISGFGVEYSCRILKSDGNMDISDSNIERTKTRVTLVGNGTFYFSNSEKGTTIDINASKSNYKVKYRTQDYYPVFISDKNGIQFVKYRLGNFEASDKWTDTYFLSEIRKLVPVLVKEDLPGAAFSKDLVFWFNVTPSFLSLLPDSISHDMGNEYKELTKSNSKDGDTNSVTTCKYFDVCQLPLERDLKVNIYPNPAQLLLNVDFELTPNTNATLYMCDLGGKIVKTIDQTYTGNQHVQIQTGDLKSGIYLVILKMSNGAVLTNKVVITGKD